MRTRIALTAILVFLLASPVFAQDVSPHDTVPIPGWVWPFGGLAVFLVGLGIGLGVLKGDLSRAQTDVAKLTKDHEEHEKEDREKYASADALKVIAETKASKEYVEGIRQGFDGKFDLVLVQLGQMKNDMDRQFMFLRAELRGENVPQAPREDSASHTPSPGRPRR